MPVCRIPDVFLRSVTPLARASRRRAVEAPVLPKFDLVPLRCGGSEWRRHLAGDSSARKRRRDGGATKPPPRQGEKLYGTGVRYALVFAPAALACSTSCVNPPASFTARSARTLRSISMPAALSPCIIWL